MISTSSERAVSLRACWGEREPARLAKFVHDSILHDPNLGVILQQTVIDRGYLAVAMLTSICSVVLSLIIGIPEPVPSGIE